MSTTVSLQNQVLEKFQQLHEHHPGSLVVPKWAKLAITTDDVSRKELWEGWFKWRNENNVWGSLARRRSELRVVNGGWVGSVIFLYHEFMGNTKWWMTQKSLFKSKFSTMLSGNTSWVLTVWSWVCFMCVFVAVPVSQCLVYSLNVNVYGNRNPTFLIFPLLVFILYNISSVNQHSKHTKALVCRYRYRKLISSQFYNTRISKFYDSWYDRK